MASKTFTDTDSTPVNGGDISYGFTINPWKSSGYVVGDRVTISAYIKTVDPDPGATSHFDISLYKDSSSKELYKSNFFTSSNGSINKSITITMNSKYVCTPSEDMYFRLYGGVRNESGNVTDLCILKSDMFKSPAPNSAPSTPSSISVPSSIQDNNSINVSWGASSDTDGNLSGYKLERQINGGIWAQVYSGPNRSFSEVTQSSWNTVYYRVSAYDSAGLYSGVKLSNAITVTHNTPPVISCSDTNLGTFGMNKPNGLSYTITDDNDATVLVHEDLDGVLKRSYNATCGVVNTFSFTDEEWLQVLNGDHTIRIYVWDSSNAMSYHDVIFTKQVNQIQFYLNPCLVASNMPSKAQESIIAELPSGSTCKVEITNNANDVSPIWQDITDKVLNDKKIMITNTIKTAANWGYNIRVTIDRGTATGPVWISGGSGFFE